MLVLAVWITRQVYPPTRAVRLRNALLFQREAAADFDWAPDHAPGEFRHEKRSPSPAFAESVKRLGLPSGATEWDRALRLAEHLASRARDLGPIQSDLGTTYARIRDGYGYCADFVKVFLALAHAADVPARQWAFSLDGFGGHGHTIVEIYDRERRKWLFMDVYNNFHARNAATGEVLSALELREALRHGAEDIEFAANGAGRAGYPIRERLLEYYMSGLDEWYLLCGNAVFSYDAHPLVRYASRLSGPLGQLVATVVGVHPRIRLLETRENSRAVRRLIQLARRFRAAVALFAVLALSLVLQLFGAALA